MGDEFYSIIKMISGEEVLSLVSIDENDGDPIIVLQNPIIMKMIESRFGTHLKVKPWIELSEDDFFLIRPEKIITMTETKNKKLIDIYNNYINEEQEIDEMDSKSPGKVKPSEKMGYISSVKEARKNLENIFKLEIEDTKER